MTNTIQWDVNKYGQLMERSYIERGDIGAIATKIYRYQDKHYVELWVNGYCVHFEKID